MLLSFVDLKLLIVVVGLAGVVTNDFVDVVELGFLVVEVSSL